MNSKNSKDEFIMKDEYNVYKSIQINVTDGGQTYQRKHK